MYRAYDYLIVAPVYFAALVQVIPAYFGFRVYRLNGYARYWSESWILFVLVMLWIGLRRLIAAITFDPDCAVSTAWIFDQIISTLVSTAAFSAIGVLQYNFFSRWLDSGKK